MLCNRSFNMSLFGSSLLLGDLISWAFQALTDLKWVPIASGPFGEDVCVVTSLRCAFLYEDGNKLSTRAYHTVTYMSYTNSIPSLHVRKLSLPCSFTVFGEWNRPKARQRQSKQMPGTGTKSQWQRKLCACFREGDSYEPFLRVSAVSHGAAAEAELRHLIVQVKTLRVPLRYKIKSLNI